MTTGQVLQCLATIAECVAADELDDAECLALTLRDYLSDSMKHSTWRYKQTEDRRIFDDYDADWKSPCS